MNEKILISVFALALVAGCATSDSAQPAKSQTQNNRFDDCTFIVAAKVRLPLAGTNQTITADGGELPTLELFTQTQSLESTGSTDAFNQTATQTPTTDVKPDIDVHYNDAVKNATDASKSVLSSLTDASAKAVLKLMESKESGKVKVTKSDGSEAVVECADGQCSLCSDCQP